MIEKEAVGLDQGQYFQRLLTITREGVHLKSDLAGMGTREENIHERRPPHRQTLTGRPYQADAWLATVEPNLPLVMITNRSINHS